MSEGSMYLEYHHYCCCCRYQLVYAFGDPQELPWLAERTAAVHAVMAVLCDMVDAGHPAVTNPKLATWLPVSDRCAAATSQVQLTVHHCIDQGWLVASEIVKDSHVSAL
jgi:hypothetical protein